jgi:hypothetical protein
MLGCDCGFLESVHNLHVLAGSVQHTADPGIECFLARQRRHLFHHRRQLVEECVWIHPLCLAFGRWGREMRELAPIRRLDFSVELRERIEVDLTEHPLNGLVVFGRVVHESTRGPKHRVRGGADHCTDTSWRIARPIRADQQIEAGFRAVIDGENYLIMREADILGIIG